MVVVIYRFCFALITARICLAELDAAPAQPVGAAYQSSRLGDSGLFQQIQCRECLERRSHQSCLDERARFGRWWDACRSYISCRVPKVAARGGLQ